MTGVREVFIDQAHANREANRQWLAVMGEVPFRVLDADDGAFFGSIFGTFNHILLGDRVWLGRIRGTPFVFDSLHQRLCGDLDALVRERSVTDDELVALVEGAADFDRVIDYRGNQNQPYSQRLREILNHLFAHQHHHRGQISQMCHQRAIEVPDGALIDFYRARSR